MKVGGICILLAGLCLMSCLHNRPPRFNSEAEEEVYWQLRDQEDREEIWITIDRIKLTELPAIDTTGRRLVGLSLAFNELSTVPEGVFEHHGLKRFSFQRNPTNELPDRFDDLPALQELRLYHNELDTLPSSLFRLSHLRTLILSENRLKRLPDSLGNLSSLETLDLDSLYLVGLPESIRRLHMLKSLNLGTNRSLDVDSLCRLLIHLPHLEELLLHKCDIQQLPPSIGRLTQLKRLVLQFNPIPKAELDSLKQRLPNTEIVV